MITDEDVESVMKVTDEHGWNDPEAVVKELLTKIMIRSIKEEGQARMGAIINLDLINAKPLREFSDKHKDDFYKKMNDQELEDFLRDRNCFDAFEQGKNAGWAESVEAISEIINGL